MGSRGIIAAGILPSDDKAAATLIAFDTLIQQLDQLLDHLFIDGSLNESTVQALNIVESAGRRGLRQCALVDAMDLPAATISRMVDGLVKNDLIIRSGHPTDRRVTMLSLTAGGEQRLARRRADYRGFAAALPPEAVEAMRTMSPLLDHFIQFLAMTAREEAA